MLSMFWGSKQFLALIGYNDLQQRNRQPQWFMKGIYLFIDNKPHPSEPHTLSIFSVEDILFWKKKKEWLSGAHTDFRVNVSTYSHFLHYVVTFFVGLVG